MWEKAKRYVCKCGGVWCMLWIKWKIKDSESERERDIDSELGDIEHWVLFFCVIYSQFSRSKGSVGHCWVIGASVATKKKHESALPKQTKSKSGANTVYARSNRTRIVESHETYQPGTSSGSSQLPEPSLSPILKTVPMGQPYSRATPSRQM